MAFEVFPDGTVDKTVKDFICTIPEMKLRINGSEDE